MSTTTALMAPTRFEHFLQLFQQLLAKAATQRSPALWLYRNNARTPLFMLEGLCKLYAKLHNKKRFEKMKEQFKLLEDALGAVDYYDSLVKELTDNKKIPLSVVKYLKAQTNNKLALLNELLIEKKWLLSDNKRVAKISSKLSDADWLSAKAEMEGIKAYYVNEIEDITQFVMDINFHFNNMEEDVHELRRKIRWLSIYPQALLGAIQLTAGKPVAKHLAKYLTKEIIHSPFNTMPPAPKDVPILQLDKNYFLALSWMIAELGKLKDKGLRIMAIKEALEKTEKLDEAAAYKRAHQLCGSKSPGLLPLLSTAEDITKQFFKEKNLLHLVKGISQ